MMFPRMRHPECTDQTCGVCMDDHIALKTYLDDSLGGNEDWLSKYHTWCTENGIRAETEHGWASPEAFREENVETFILEWKEQDEEAAK